MILDLGTISSYVHVTAQYSNAVLVAVLPYFSDVAKKLDLPVPQPITQADVAGFHVLPFRGMTASMLLKNGWVFNFGSGYVRDFSSPHSYHNLQNPDEIPKYYGQPKLSKDQAVQLARQTLKKLGIHLEDVFAEQEPSVTLPETIGTNTVSRYQVTWFDPYGSKAVSMEINAETKQVERLALRSKNLERPPPKINIVPSPAPLDWPSVNPEYASQLIPMMFKAIDDYGQKLSLPIPRLLTTNNVAKVTIYNNEGWPHAEIELTNGWQFVYRHTMVNSYYAPDNLFDSDKRPIHIKEFEGKWNLTTNQAIEVVREAMAKLDYPTNYVHMDFAPSVYTAAVDREHIPRLRFEWYYSVKDELQSRLEAEVNADDGKLKSLYYDDKAYWDNRPPIDVPISIK
jgi:hypothetical protein